MNREQTERLMRLLDLAMSEMVNSNANQKAFDYLSQAMTIVERSYYSTDGINDERQMELDFNEVDYRNIPTVNEDD